MRHDNKVDVHVGKRARTRRVLLGLSQEAVAAALGVTFQQLQKNEKGKNRMGASRLYLLSKALGVPISYFFEGLDEPLETVDPEADRGALETVRAMQGLPAEMQAAFRKLIRHAKQGIARPGGA